MPENRILAVAGGAILFLLGLVIGRATGGPGLDQIEAAFGQRVEAVAAAEGERLASLEAGLAALAADMSGGLEGLRAGVDAGGQSVAALGEKLGGDLEGVQRSLTGALEASGAASLAALESGLAGLRGQIPAAAPAPAAEADAPASPAAAAPADPGTPPVGFTPGQTAVLSDGALRAFVSRIDDAAGTAWLRVNGTDMMLEAGATETLASPAGDCRITLDAVDRGHAAISGACGDDLPPPVGAAPGTIVTLADGLRVFVSGVTDDGARIAINGVDTQTVPVGEAVDVAVGEQTCRVSVETVDRGRVALGYVCG